MNWLRAIGASRFNLAVEKYLNIINRKILKDISKNAELLYDAHLIVRTDPVNLNPRDEQIFKTDKCFQLNAAYLFKVKRAFILYNFIFNWTYFFSYAPFFHIRGLTLRGLSKLRMLIYPTEKISKGIWITDNWSFNYFHWLLDTLPKLICTESYWATHVLILPEELKQQSFIVETLPYFKLPVKYSNFNKKIIVNELLLPSYLAFSGNYNKEVLRKLRNKLVGPFENPPFRKIYISRAKANKRKILNESELTDFLELQGFEIHCFEDYSLSTQIQLMKETKCLVGLHGAGLANMLFMQPGGKILELRNEGGTVRNCFFILASDLEHEYYYLLNKGNSLESHLADLYVDLSDLNNVSGYFKNEAINEL